jgi:mycothiol synthase
VPCAPGPGTVQAVARIDRKLHLGHDEIAAVSELLAAATAADDHAPLDEHAWLDLVQGGREGFAGLVAWQPGHPHPVGYAQVTRGADSWAVEYVVDPHHRVPDNRIGEDLLAEAAAVIAEQGGGHVHLWVSRPGPVMDRVAATISLHPGRALYQMRRPLPVEAVRADPDPVETRPFVPGRDEEAWLEVNNRAFDWHPEQGNWDVATLKQREAASWFDPDGFLLHEEDGRLIGFCWTKIHADHDPPLGEIYVIAVDPTVSRHGLGRRLTLAGLDHMARAGITIGMLYCDATNAPAVKLYVDLGFTVNHIDQAYVGDIGGAAPS